MRQPNQAFVRVLAVLACVAVLDAATASAQARRTSGSTTQAQGQNATQDDIDRLMNSVYDTQRAVSRLRDRDSALADRLARRLDDVRDEVTYLKVKLRKEGRVSRNEIADARDNLEQVRAQALGDIPDANDRPAGTSGAYGRGNESGAYGRGNDDSPYRRDPVQQGREARPNEVPDGTELDVRLQTSLSSATAQVEDPFTATTLVDLMSGDRVLIPAGSTVRGVVASVDKAGRIERKGRLTLRIDRMSIGNRSFPIRAEVTDALESEGYKGDAAKIGAGAGVGAIIGGILGGAKGALAGILIGGGGVVAATEGQDVDLPAGTVLRIRFEEPVTVR